VTTLDTGVKVVRNVGRFTFGDGAALGIADLVASKRTDKTKDAVYLIDDYFKNDYYIASSLGAKPTDAVHFVSTVDEPTTQSIDVLVATLQKSGHTTPATIIGYGGGITLDTAKAVSNLLTNGGRAADYQGWDLVKVPGVTQNRCADYFRHWFGSNSHVRDDKSRDRFEIRNEQRLHSVRSRDS